MSNFKLNEMKIANYLALPALALGLVFATSSCSKDDDNNNPTTTMKKSTFDYEFNNGQVVPSAAYDGMHSDNLMATMEVIEKSSSTVEIKVTLENTISGEMYMIHAHDAADPATTPNGTPYNETPNADVFTQMVTGNGSSVTATQTVSMSYNDIVANYEGFFVVHDPLQPVSTTDISSYLVVGTFARMQGASNLASMSFMYDFNTGQVAPAFAYSGSHANTLGGTLKVQELGNGESRVTVMLDNSLAGQTYMVHAHDAADPATTPNGTPYNETPNSDLCTLMIMGNGNSAYSSQISTLSYADITSNYSGFFVVHDPLQAISTTDPTTYVLLGVFAR